VRPLGLPTANIVAISSEGEMALLLGNNDQVGTLARAPLAGGPPREVLEDARGAAWSPDGKGLAAVRAIGGKNRLEYPIGRVLYESSEFMSRPRFSPRGDLILVQEGDSFAVVDLKGSKRTLPSGLNGTSGWSPTGREVWWTESEGGVTNFEAIGLDGKRRRLASLPGIYFIQDISPEGALLLERESTECVMMGQLPGVEGERDISWLDFSIPVDISADG